MDVQIVSSAVVAAATVAIAYFTFQVKRAAEQAAEREEAFRGQLSDLYKAIVIATLVGAGEHGGTVERAIGIFRNQYDGQTPILKS